MAEPQPVIVANSTAIKTVKVYSHITTFQIPINTTYLQLPSVESSEITFTNDASSADTIYLGDLGVTSSNGYPIAKGGTVTINIENLDKLYAVTASGTATLDVIVLK